MAPVTYMFGQRSDYGTKHLVAVCAKTKEQMRIQFSHFIKVLSIVTCICNELSMAEAPGL